MAAMNVNDYDIKAFRFYDEPTNEMTVLEFTYADDSSERVLFSTDMLSRLDDELTASLERNATRRSERGVGATNWPLHAVRRPKNSGAEELITAWRVSTVSLFEGLDGETLMICFGHGKDNSTVVHMTNEAAQLLVQHTRNRIAFRM
jgi:hypothetical protein